MAAKFQFSIRFLLLLSAVVGLTVASYLWRPSMYSLAARGALTVIIASLLIVASIFSMGAKRAFLIGAAVPPVLAAFVCALVALQLAVAYRSLGASVDQQIEQVANILRFNVAYWCFAPVNGAICALAYWLLHRNELPK
jgi:uncharacterized membrane protein